MHVAAEGSLERRAERSKAPLLVDYLLEYGDDLRIELGAGVGTSQVTPRPPGSICQCERSFRPHRQRPG